MIDKLLSFEEAQERTGIRVSTWRSWAAARKIAVVRLGRRVKVRERDVERLVEAGIVPAAPEPARVQRPATTEQVQARALTAAAAG